MSRIHDCFLVDEDGDDMEDDETSMFGDKLNLKFFSVRENSLIEEKIINCLSFGLLFPLEDDECKVIVNGRVV